MPPREEPLQLHLTSFLGPLLPMVELVRAFAASIPLTIRVSLVIILSRSAFVLQKLTFPTQVAALNSATLLPLSQAGQVIRKVTTDCPEASRL